MVGEIHPTLSIFHERLQPNPSLAYRWIAVRATKAKPCPLPGAGLLLEWVGRHIQQGQMTRFMDEMISHEREPTLGETTLEDFLVKAGLYVADSSLGPAMGLDNTLAPQSFTPQMGLSPSPSIDTLSDTPIPGRKRYSGDFDRTLERRLRRKIKNRESAARSRARKQAYHNELVSKVSCLEELNTKLKKEKEWEKTMSCNFDQPRYQLRRTSSF
ncbi:ABSCISIC ACID-INSENSITIVE 5-like protein 2 [Olea europaea var. sylvestris]|uniref:ABSCISIC ACID-INSENSITIVE 5-like protein 2 n=1 Tax=Olea europaea var. sylvestris TaxID=158386 RepID=UPI000C1D1500|nr:ABSCISIC ACID-INSENSITIVE 5-like protein 2 [Olea europaea var. sylvestris]